MSTDADEEQGDSRRPVTISLRRGEDADVWIAEDEDTGVVSQGTTRVEALENLDEAVAGYYGAGTRPSDDDLDALDIDSEANTSEHDDEAGVFDLS